MKAFTTDGGVDEGLITRAPLLTGLLEPPTHRCQGCQAGNKFIELVALKAREDNIGGGLLLLAVAALLLERLVSEVVSQLAV